MYQLLVGFSGRLLEGYGCEIKNDRYYGGSVFNDTASVIICVENQLSLGARETVPGKRKFEDWIYEQATVEVRQYLSDNFILT